MFIYGAPQKENMEYWDQISRLGEGIYSTWFLTRDFNDIINNSEVLIVLLTLQEVRDAVLAIYPNKTMDKMAFQGASTMLIEILLA